MNNNVKGNLWLPNRVTNILPFLELTGRQWQVVWLILRLTYGCINRWAKLKLVDFRVVKISPTHIRDVIDPLIEKKIIIWVPKENKFRFNEEELVSKFTTTGSIELEELGKLIGKNLKRKTSQKGNTKVPDVGNERLLDEESIYSQNSNNSELELATSKEIIKPNNKENSKLQPPTSLRKKKFNPEFFVPQRKSEQVAFEIWHSIEPNNPNNFEFYKEAARNVDYGILYQIKDEVINNKTIENKGAAFVNKIKPYLKHNDQA